MAWVKNRYSLSPSFHIFFNIDCGGKTVYNVEVFTVKLLKVTDWETCPAEIVKSCFKQGSKQEADRPAKVYESGGGEKLRAQMQRNATEHSVSVTCIGMDALLISKEENDVVDSFLSMNSVDLPFGLDMSLSLSLSMTCRSNARVSTAWMENWRS